MLENLDSMSKYCIYKAKELGEDYYCVKVRHKDTGEERFIFINHSFTCSRKPGNGAANSLHGFPSSFRGDTRNLDALPGGWKIINCKRC